MDENDIWFDRAVRAGEDGDHPAAQAAWREVVATAPGRTEAWLGLGLSLTAARRFEEAVEPLARACRDPEAPALWRLCLAQTLYMAGRFTDSAAIFDEAALTEPLAPNARLTRARAHALAAMIAGPIEAALDRYAVFAGPEAEPARVVIGEAMPVLAVFGHADAARAAGRWLVENDPADPLHAHALAALEGQALDRAPAAYVETLFDRFAERFDGKLVDDLGYRAPGQMVELVMLHRPDFSAVLDLGCGTGLGGEALVRLGAPIVGVDLSGAMLEKARARGQYRELVRDDLAAFLPTRPAAFDLVFAADVLIYFGDLASVVDGVAAALEPGGLFAFSTEHGDADWRLLSSGRFSHGQAYLHRLAAERFDVLDEQWVTLRREGSGAAEGLLSLWRRH